jgi:hypothetical protein
MSKGHRRFLLLLTAAALLLFAFGAAAQELCSDVCDPYTSGCSDPCFRCRGFNPDGSCLNYVETTCGGPNNANCIPDGCTPSWSETSRVTQGTYDGNNWNECSHHSVQWVTLYDSHQCNTNSNFWTQHYCDDVIDGHKSGFSPDCCDGYDGNGNLNPLFTCNGYHSCTG